MPGDCGLRPLDSRDAAHRDSRGDDHISELGKQVVAAGAATRRPTDAGGPDSADVPGHVKPCVAAKRGAIMGQHQATQNQTERPRFADEQVNSAISDAER
jgi:hypothetical protein